MRNNFKITRMPILSVLFILLSLTLANGLGVSPASQTIYFKPNTTINLEFAMINSEGNSFDAHLEGYGEIKDLMFFENSYLQVNASSYVVPFKLMLRFPSEMEPGVRTGSIKITPSFGQGNEGNLVAYVAPQIPLSIKVPYPFKYADVSVVFLNVDEGTPVPIFVEFDNMGSDDIISARATVEIYDQEGQLLANTSAPEISIAKGGFGKTQAQPAPIMRKGIYSAVVKAYYDGIEKLISTNFTVGEPLIRVEELMVKNLFRNEINRVTFRVHSEWNTELSVGGFLELDGKKQELPNFKIDKGQEKEILGFFDTTGLADGDYVIKITLAYANQIKTETFPVTISEKIAKPEKLLTTPIIIMLIILIVIILVVVAVLIIKKKKKEKI